MQMTPVVLKWRYPWMPPAVGAKILWAVNPDERSGAQTVLFLPREDAHTERKMKNLHHTQYPKQARSIRPIE